MREAKAAEVSLMGIGTKFVAFLVALVMAFSLGAMAPLAAYAANTSDDGEVTVEKTASDLDENNQTDVTLSIGSSESKDNVAVMFLIDKSTSQAMRNEAAAMLQELATKTNTNIVYDVVTFAGDANSTGWLNVADDQTLQDTIDNFVNSASASGTNMDAGIELATSDLAALDSAYTTTYLITLSDGITYVWNEDGTCSTVPTVGWNSNEDAYETGATSPITGNDSWNMLYKYYADNGGYSIEDLFGTFDAYLEDVQERLANTRDAGYVQEYGSVYDYSKVLETYIYNEEANKEVAETYAVGADFALYESATGFASLVELFSYSYTYAVPEITSTGEDNSTNWANFPWGLELMKYLNSMSTNAGEAEVSNADAEEIFSSIADDILYTIQSGTVTDVIGSDFDLTDAGSITADTFTITVGGEEVAGVLDGDNANKVNYYDSEGALLYSVEYQVADDGTETLVWTINTPVVATQNVELTYSLTLVNKSEVAGEYEPPTNEWAELEYEGTDGEKGTVKFPVPTVKYTVEGSETSTTPGDSGTDNTNNNTQVVNVNNGSNTSGSSLPKTSDTTLPFAAGLVALVVLASGAGIVAWRKSR